MATLLASLSFENNKLFRYGEWLVLFALMLGSLWFRLRAIPSYPVTEDEFITLAALKGVVSTGVPRFGEDGPIYWRALFAHYLMAIPLFFSEATIQTARIVPTLFSVLILPVAYAGGRLLSGRAAAWLTVFVLAFSNYQNYHAAFARFYMPFQFFFLAATLLAGSYFILGRDKHGPWLIVATLATLASHALAVTILPLLAWAFLCSWRWQLLRSWSFVCAIILIACFTWINIFWTPEQAFVNTMAVTLNVGGLVNKWAYYETFRQYLPLGWTLVLLGVLPVVWSRSRLWFYLWSGFIGQMVFLSLIAPDPNVRYMCHLFAFGVLLAIAAPAWCVGQFVVRVRQGSLSWPRQVVLLAAVVVLGAGSHLVLAENLDLRSGFGNTLISYDQEPAHQFMARLVTANDVVISMEPGITEYYLNRPVNYFLREKFDPVTREFSSYPLSMKRDNPEYFIDSPERLQEVLDSTRQRVWIYLNHKTLITTSKALRDLMEKNFSTVFGDEQMQTYVLVRY